MFRDRGVNARLLNVKAVEATFNQEKALVGAFSVITNLWMDLFEAQILPQVFEPVSRGFPARPRRHRRGPGGLLQHQEVLRVSEGLEDHAGRRPAEH